MVLATPDLRVAEERIREISGKDPEDFDETEFLIELENREEAILKRFGLAEDDESASEDEILEDDEDA